MMEYHIHVNALSLSEISEIDLTCCGIKFKPFDFSVSGTSYTPKKHYSFKTNDEGEFESSFESVKQILRHDNKFVGYVEGEFIQSRHEIARAISARQTPVFKLELVPPKTWREAEVHVVAEAGSEITNYLNSAGLYKSAIVKSGKLFEINTAQGATTFISDLFLFLSDFCGQYADKSASIKLEILSHLYTSENFNWCAPQATGYLPVEKGMIR